MASTFSTNLAIELIGTGDQAGTWGATTNTNLGTLIEQAISGYVTQAVSTGADTTITIPNGATGVARNMYIELTGTGGTNTNLIVPSNKKLYFIFNNTSSGQVTVKVSGQTGVSVPNGKKMVLVCNGTDIVNGLNYIADFGTNSFTVTNLTATSANITTLTSSSATITNLIATSASITTLTNNPTFSAGTANGVLYLNGSKVATSGSALTFDGTDLATTGGVRLNNAQYYYGKNAAGSAVRLLGINAGNVNYVGAIDSGPTELNYGAASTVTTHAWNISGTGAMALTSTGLGIGTASPAFKLDVLDGTANGSVGTPIARIVGANQAITGETGTLSLQSNSNMAADTGGSIILGGRGTTASTNSVSYGHIAGRKENGTSGNFAGYLQFGTSDSASDITEWMRITSAGLVGIGTASPAYKLDVRGSTDTSYFNITSTADANSTTLRIGTDATAAFINATGSSSGTLQLRTYGTTRATLDSSGNLGIGTAPPAAKLDVNGNSIFTVANAAYAAAFNSTSGNLRIIPYVDATQGTSLIAYSAGYAGNGPLSLDGSQLRFYTGGTVKAVIDSSGNFGLGVTPSAWGRGKAFEFGSIGNSLWGDTGPNGIVNVTANAYLSTSNLSTGWKYAYTGPAGRYQISETTHSWYTAASGTAGNTISFTQAMTLDSSGNLGVGTTSTDSRIHAYGSGEQYIRVGSATGTDYRGFIIAGTDSDATAYGQLKMELSAGQMQLIAGTAAFGGFLTIHTNGSERMRVTADGNIVAGASVALATTATNGFLYVPTCAGTPTGTPTAITGMAPIVVDTTNNKLYFYSGGAWRDAGP